MEARKNRKALRRYVIPISLGFCCLFFAGVALAKMMTSEPIERDGETQVAGWSVNVTSSDNDHMILDAGASSQSYSLAVTNNSEVASSYSIKVSNIPDGVKVGLDIASDADMETPTDGTLIFTNTGGDLSYIAPNNERTHFLTLAAEASADITQSDVDMSIEVLFAQKDPRS